jgi:hypothetical protein
VGGRVAASERMIGVICMIGRKGSDQLMTRVNVNWAYLAVSVVPSWASAVNDQIS